LQSQQQQQIFPTATSAVFESKDDVEDDDDVIVETYGDRRSSVIRIDKRQNDVFMNAPPIILNENNSSRRKISQRQFQYVDTLVDNPIKTRRVAKVNRAAGMRERRLSDGDEVVLRKFRSIKHKSRSPIRRRLKGIKNLPISLRIEEDSTRTKRGKKEAKLIYKEPRRSRERFMEGKPMRREQNISIANNGYYADGFDDVVLVDDGGGQRRGKSKERTIKYDFDDVVLVEDRGGERRGRSKERTIKSRRGWNSTSTDDSGICDEVENNFLLNLKY